MTVRSLISLLDFSPFHMQYYRRLFARKAEFLSVSAACVRDYQNENASFTSEVPRADAYLHPVLTVLPVAFFAVHGAGLWRQKSLALVCVTTAKCPVVC